MLAPILDLFQSNGKERLFFWIALLFFTFSILRNQYQMDQVKADWLAKPVDTVFITSADIKFQPQQSPFPKKSKTKSLRLHSFNPNTIDKSQLLAMNLPAQLVHNWVNFRDKGAQYNSIKDVSKIYGITPYISQLQGYMIFPKNDKDPDESNIPLVKKSTPIKVELNQADSVALIKVYGIGPVLAKRIIKFRTVLGGFYKFEQLHEVYGLDSTTIGQINKQFYLDSGAISKFNINAVDKHTLAKHPYISKNQASLIKRYIQNHGPFNSTHDMRQIKGLKPSVIDRISPYLILK